MQITDLQDGDMLVNSKQEDFLFNRRYSKRYEIGVQDGNYTTLTDVKTNKCVVLNWSNKKIITTLEKK